MSLRACSGPTGTGCPTGELIPKGQRRCGACASVYERGRGTASQRGYGSKHQRLRDEWQRRIDAGKQVYCWRCGKRITGTRWQLGHCDDDRTIYHGPEDAACNLATAGRTRCPHRSHN